MSVLLRCPSCGEPIAMLAQIMYEETNVRRMWIFPPGSGEGPGAYANEYGSLAQDLAGTPRTEKTPRP